MSRSYKKTPYCGDKKGKIKKRLANHIIRQKLKNPEFECQNMSYKNVGFDRWNLCDSYSIYPWERQWDYLQKTYQAAVNGNTNYYYRYNLKNQKIEKPNYKEEYRDWYRHYRMK